MAVKKGIVIAGFGVAGAPVVGYFVYRQLTGGSTGMEPQKVGTFSYTKSDHFKAGPCAKKLFGDTEFKFLSGGKSEDDFDLKWGNETGNVEGCQILHVKHQGEKGPLAASSELAATQGNKGFVMWTFILGKSIKGVNVREEVRVVVLEKSENKWEVKRGFSWFTQAGSGKSNARGIKIKVTGTENKTFDNSDGKVWEEKNPETEYKKQWSFKGSSTSSDSEGVFSKLEVTYDKDNSKKSGLYGTTDYKIPLWSTLYGAMDNDGKWSPSFRPLKKDVYFPFKDIKGKWEADS